jgi:hypothetical protein
MLVPVTEANTLLFADNFDTANTTNLDGSPLAGRLTGTLASSVSLRSALAQHHILANQLRFSAGGRTRFQTSPSVWQNWATAPTGTSILADGGIRIEFDWTPPNNTTTNWVSFDIGFPKGTTLAEPGTRVNHPETDYGILFRDNGAIERFDNGFNRGPGLTFDPVLTNRHVVIDYAFDSFANGTTVKMMASVNGTVVTTGVVGGLTVPYETFFWDNNAGELYFELGTNETGQLIDNYSVSTIPAIYSLSVDKSTFISGIDPSQLVATLSGGTFAKGTEPSTFTFVTGDGDMDNAKFQINGDRLEAGTYDFTQDFGGMLYFVRVKGTGTVSGGEKEMEFVLTLIKDDDADNLLDDWELSFANDLTELTGLVEGPGPGAGTGDFDGDGISDIDEYDLSLTTQPGISPVLADTDGDGLDDDEELAGAGQRPITSAVREDTDGDGLNDKIESNSGTFLGATDSGTNPTLPDTDGDGSRDKFEVDKGSVPTDIASRPVLPPSVEVVAVTDDLSTGLSAATTYTHAISGGGVATVNGVVFEELGAAVTPLNFNWTVSSGAKGEIDPINNGDWVPANGGVTGPGLLDLFGGFTYGTTGNPGVTQTYVLSGLTIGQSYKLKLFVRKWDTDGSGRPIDLIFTNGATVEQPFGALLADRPGIVLNNGNDDSAYYVSYTYVAEATDLIVEAPIHTSAIVASGSFHMYGLTNEVVGPPSTELKITSVTRTPTGDIVINFTGAADTEFDVTKSPDLTTAFGPLTAPLTATTNSSGVGQVVIPASEASETKEFYRIEE